MEITDSSFKRMEAAYNSMLPGGADSLRIPADLLEAFRDIIGHSVMDEAWGREADGEVIEVVRVKDPPARARAPESRRIEQLRALKARSASSSERVSEPVRQRAAPKLPESVRQRLIAEGKMRADG